MAAEIYDLCIVGAGIIGTAAARHASKRPGVKVCLIGPNEPETKTMDRDIYGAHYDEGRIARSAHSHKIWAKLAGNSIKRFKNLEEESGIQFFTESGNLIAGTNTDPYIGDVENVARNEHLEYKILTEQEAKTSFPYLKFPSSTSYIYQSENGHISPRNMVQAQKTVALKQGCTILNDIVCRISRCVNSNGSYVMTVETETGKKIQSISVLVATGAFTTFRNLIPGLQLDIELDPAAVAKVEVSRSVAEKLGKMPCVKFLGEGHPDWLTDSVTAPGGVHTYYMLPPILYPNGRYYIKLGLFHSTTSPFTSLEDVKRWFVYGNPQFAETTRKYLLSLFNDLETVSWQSDFCVIVVTPTFLPYIDKVYGQLGVTVGGNGLGAMSGDEIGRLGAEMMFGEWSTDIPREHFQLRFKQQQKSYL